MLSRIKNLENDFSVGKAAVIIGVFTLLSKLVALFRDPLILGRIGVGDTTDIYFSAFRIPDFIFQLLVLGTLSVAFIPVFTEWLIKDKEKANRIASSVLNSALIGMAVICLILFVFASPLTKLLVPGFEGLKLARTIRLTRLFLLSPLIFTISSVFTSILSSHKKFFMLSLAPILYNLGIIFGLFVFYPVFGLMGLGFGVTLGALMHMCVQIPEVLRHGFRWQAILDWKDKDVRKIGKLFLPRIIGMDISQVSLIIGTTVGSILAAGSVTIFNAANNLQAVPLGVFALSVSQASFPLLSEHFANQNYKAFLRTLTDNIMQVLYFIIPFTVLMFLFRSELVSLVYKHGKFTANDISILATTFGIMTFGLLSQSLSPLFSRAFYAKHNTITPVMINACTIVLNAFLSYYWGVHYGLIGIASAFATACTVDALIMAMFLRSNLSKDRVSFAETDKEVVSFLAKVTFAAIAMGLIGFILMNLMNSISAGHNFIHILIKSGISVGLAALAFVLLTDKLGVKQSGQMLAFLRRIL